jgi:hypothetical protein
LELAPAEARKELLKLRPAFAQQPNPQP